MEYITTKEAAEKWGISTSRITLLASEGRIPGAKHLGRSWMIPANADKPGKLKPNHFKNAKRETENFLFPLYHFHPNWGYIKNTKLSNQQQLLLQAETAVLECRFSDVYPLLEPIMSAPDNVVTEIGCLCNICISSMALNKPDDFTRSYMRLQMLLSEDFPHHDDLAIIHSLLKTYVDSISDSANNNDFSTDINEQCLPLTCMLIGYTQLCKEIISSGSADTTILELILRFLQTTSAFFTVEMMHIYLMCIYSARRNFAKAETHAKSAVKIAYDNKLYFPLITYYQYNTMILSPILAQYPKDFQDHCLNLYSQYDVNYADFLESLYEYSAIPKLDKTDFPYICAVSMGLSNSQIAEKLDISPQTVTRKLDKLYAKLDVNNKKELREYLHKYM